MSDLNDNHTNTQSVLDSNSFPPSNGRLARYPSLTYSETIDLWSHATLLYHNLEWEQSLSTHRRILRQCGTDLRKGFLWFNIGAIRAILGEYYLAAEAFAKAIKYEPDFAVGWYCLGISLFELDVFRSAKKAFDKCLHSFAVEERIDYHKQGLDFVLEKTRVEWNCRQALLEKSYKKAGKPLSLDRHSGLNTMPAGILFEPPSFESDNELGTDHVAVSTPEPSSELGPTSSSSGRLRKHLQSLLRNKPKQSAKFEHSDPRLQALDDEVLIDSEPRKETIVSILAPSATHRSQSVQAPPPEANPQPTSRGGGQNMKFSNSPTWPKSSKPPAALTFVTARDLSMASNAPDLPPNPAARRRARTIPQGSITSQGQPSTGVIYHEGSIISTEYIPTTSNLNTFLERAPMALVQDPPPRHTDPSDIPAPLSIPRWPQDPPVRPTPTSPTSIYSRPFSSSQGPNPDPTPTSTNPSKPKPTTAATQSWLDETFPPPRWDSFPSHLRPARRPSSRRPRHPERQQHSSSPTRRSRSPPNVDERRSRPPTPFANSAPKDNADLDAAPLLPPERHRDTMASMDSFAIVGMGRQAARWDEGVGWANGVGVGTGRDEASPEDGSPDQGRGKGKEKGKRRWPGLGSRKDR